MGKGVGEGEGKGGEDEEGISPSARSSWRQVVRKFSNSWYGQEVDLNGEGRFSSQRGGGGGRCPPPSSRMSAMMPAHASGGSYPSRDLLVRRQQALLEVRRRRMSLPRESSTQAHPLRARDAVTLLLALT